MVRSKSFWKISLIVAGVIVLFTGIVPAQNPPWISDSHTVAMFHFNETNVNNITDASGNGAVFVPGSTASMTTAGKFSNALRLVPRAQTSDAKTVVQLPGGIMNPNSFCIDLWFRINNDDSNAPPARTMYIFSSSNCFLRYKYTDAQNIVLEFGLNAINESGWQQWIQTTTANFFRPRPNTWYYAVCSYDGSKISLYVDGALMGTAAATGSISQTSFVAGGVGWANELTTELDGYIDEWRFSTIVRQGFYKNPKIDILKYPVAGSGQAAIWVYDANGAVSPAHLKMIVRNSQSQIVTNVNEPLPSQLPAEKRLSLGTLANDANYTVEVSIVGNDGFSTSQEIVEFYMPLRPVWADTNAGELNGEVLNPWTPIETNGTALSCWGRTYDLGDSLLPVSIVSSGHQITSGRLFFTVGNGFDMETINHAQSPAVVSVSQTGDAADFSASATSSYCDVNIAGTLEFDGLMTFDMSIFPKQEMDTFILDIPLANELAKYIMPINGPLTYTDPAGAIPASGTMYYSLSNRYDTINATWICNGDAGLFFVMDSLQNVQTDGAQIIELVRRGSDTLVRIRLYKSSGGFNSKRIYSFRLQATPLRPFNSDWYKTGCRTMNGLNWGDNVTALENDTVLSLSMATAPYASKGMFEIIVQNKNNLKEIIQVSDFPNAVLNEKILKVADATKEISIFFQKEYDRNAMVLQTPWGSIWQTNNCFWDPNETHKLAFTWGDKLRFYVDGILQGSLSVTGLPMQYPSCKLGSVSARYVMKQLRVSKAIDINSLSSIEPMPQTSNTLVIYNDELNLRSNARTPLHAARDIGVKTMIFFEHWNPVENGGVSRLEPVVRNMVEDCHRIGLKIILYFGFQITEAPEHADMIDECRAYIYKPADYFIRQYCHFVGYGGPYQEYLLYNMKRLKDEMGIDGVYLDGTFMLTGSDNPAFDCGYVDGSGQRAQTLPLDRIREFSKKINKLFVQDGGIVYAHLGVAPPTMGFATNIYYGENNGFLVPWQSIMDRVSLNVSQVVYNHNNTGVPVVLNLQNAAPQFRDVVPNWYALSSTWGDIHGVFMNTMLENPMSPEITDMLTKQRKLSQFGADEASWIPYWQTDGLVTTQPASTFKVSGYRRVDGAVVCAIMNNTGQQASGWVDLSGTPLQPRAGVTCEQLVSGMPVTFSNNRISVVIPAYEGLLVRMGGQYPVADFSHDFCVDFKDFALFAQDWASVVFGSDYDFNEDNIVNMADFSIFAEHWLSCDTQ